MSVSEIRAQVSLDLFIYDLKQIHGQLLSKKLTSQTKFPQWFNNLKKVEFFSIRPGVDYIVTKDPTQKNRGIFTCTEEFKLYTELFFVESPEIRKAKAGYIVNVKRQKKSDNFWSLVYRAGSLKCNTCDKYKGIDGFRISSGKRTISGLQVLHSICKKCETTRETSVRNSATPKLVFAQLLRSAKGRRKEKIVGFDLTIEFLYEIWDIQKGNCFYTGIPMTLESNNPNKVSLDRIDSSRPYTKDNVVLTRYIINRMKQEFSIKDFISECNNVSRFNCKV